jgi:transposase-like protein
MVAESFTPGAPVSKIAERYGVNANLSFTWRRQEGRRNAVGGAEPLRLLPVVAGLEDWMRRARQTLAPRRGCPVALHAHALRSLHPIPL